MFLDTMMPLIRSKNDGMGWNGIEIRVRSIFYIATYLFSIQLLYDFKRAVESGFFIHM